MRSKIVILKTNMFRSSIIANTSSDFSEMDEADILYQSYYLPHNYGLTSDTVSEFGGWYMI